MLNAPEMLANSTLILGMVGILVSAALFGDAATRDVQTRVHALFHTSPIAEAEYLGGRFLGALVVNAVLLLGIPVGLLIAAYMPYLPDEMFGPIQLTARRFAYWRGRPDESVYDRGAVPHGASQR